MWFFVPKHFPANLGQTERSVGGLYNLLLAHKDKHLLAFSLSSALLCLALCYWPLQTFMEEDFSVHGYKSRRAEAAWTGVLVWGSPARGWWACINPDHASDLFRSERTQSLSLSHAQTTSATTTSSHIPKICLWCLYFSSNWVVRSFCLPAGSAVCDTIQEKSLLNLLSTWCTHLY